MLVVYPCTRGERSGVRPPTANEEMTEAWTTPWPVAAANLVDVNELTGLLGYSNTNDGCSYI